ncbi:MAG: hypothetical protein ACI8WB_004421 [Phenylobacterium sp.]|jgi:hypothetical protein
MRKTAIFLSTLWMWLWFSGSAYAAGAASPTSAQDADTIVIVSELSKMYRASMNYIFKNQPLINQTGGDKSKLFGNKFIANVKLAYKENFKTEFPKQNHILKKMMVEVMVEVMEDNRTLIKDDDIAYKGFIPAIYAFQLSEKLSTKGLGVKIRITNLGNLRNKLNVPDKWEVSTMEVIRKLSLNIYFDDTSTFDGKPAYRYFVPLKMSKLCLGCHGIPSDNPQNKGKDPSQWSHIDVTGFEMERWKLTDFGGGISVTIYKRDF